MGRKLDQHDLGMRDADRSLDRGRKARRYPANEHDQDLTDRWDHENFRGRAGMLDDEDPIYPGSAREEMDLDTLRGGSDQFFRDEEAMHDSDAGSGDRWSRQTRRRSEHPRDARNRR